MKILLAKASPGSKIIIDMVSTQDKTGALTSIAGSTLFVETKPRTAQTTNHN